MLRGRPCKSRSRDTVKSDEGHEGRETTCRQTLVTLWGLMGNSVPDVCVEKFWSAERNCVLFRYLHLAVRDTLRKIKATRPAAADRPDGERQHPQSVSVCRDERLQTEQVRKDRLTQVHMFIRDTEPHTHTDTHSEGMWVCRSALWGKVITLIICWPAAASLQSHQRKLWHKQTLPLMNYMLCVWVCLYTSWGPESDSTVTVRGPKFFVGSQNPGPPQKSLI